MHPYFSQTTAEHRRCELRATAERSRLLRPVSAARRQASREAR